MKKIHLYPVEAYEFQFVSMTNWVELIMQQDLKPRPNTGVLNCGPRLQELAEFSEMTTFFEHCLNDIQEDNNYDCDGFRITSMWGNYYPVGTSQEPHRHANSYWSGCLYLNTSAPTVFYDPLMQRSLGQIELNKIPKIDATNLTFNTNAEHVEKIESTPGKLIIFPSWMVHDTAVTQEERWSVSFNALPVGVINKLTTIEVL